MPELKTTQVSNYFVLQDANFELDAGEIKEFTVKMPSAIQVAGQTTGFVKETARPILWFNMHPLTSQQLKFIVLLNDLQADPNNIPSNKIVWNYDSGDDVRLLRSTHEVLDGNQFLPGVDNQIAFRVIIGKVRLSDVVLSYRVEIVRAETV